VGLLTAGEGGRAKVGQSSTWLVETIRLQAVSPVVVGSRQCRLFRGGPHAIMRPINTVLQ